MASLNLSATGIHVSDIRRNWSPAKLYEEAIRTEPGAAISDSGALIAYSGEKTGRSPADKRVVSDILTKDDVWWGPVNIPISTETFAINLERAEDYLNTRRHLYVVDAFAGWDPAHRLKVRVICSRPYHALFMHLMLIRPTADELASFGEPELVIYNAGAFPANRNTRGMTSKTSVDLNLATRQFVILGTEYAGEMKKGVFTVMNYLMPKRGVLSMHCSATVDAKTNRSSILFGLSGTGKTTLSADPKRELVGDDEHCWSDAGIFNIEGGCYAKAIDLTSETEPEIFQALRFGSVLENVIYDEATHHVDFHNTRITQNTRGAYAIDYIHNARIPCLANHPADVIFLTCDAYGVLPPVSRLTPEQAMYHYISGYTARVAGTEQGVNKPKATFSPCFGGPFLIWRPAKYAQLLAEKLQQHRGNVWLVNTGWSGGPPGVGKRMKLAISRAIVDAIHEGALSDAPSITDPVFGFRVITHCPGVPADVLQPRNAWADKAAYDTAARKLATLFAKNFEPYAADCSLEVRQAGPSAG